jgi:4a-hydroxytetrahydrobiopterin dehydratase
VARTPLSQAKIDEGLASLKGWKFDGEAGITREFRLKDHIAALGFVVQVAAVAETLDHHPSVNWTYNTVTFTLSTHDAGGVTQRDFELASRIDALR